MKIYSTFLITSALLIPIQSGASEHTYPRLAYEGSVNILSLEPVIEGFTGDILAGVKAYDFQMNNSSNLCPFVSTSGESVIDGPVNRWRCHFEWENEIPDINNLGRTIQGVFPHAGSIEVPYSISVYSGSGGDKVKVSSGIYRFNIVEPPLPEVKNARVNWVSEQLEGLEQFLGYPNSKLSSVQFIVEPKPYPQVVSFRGNQCIVSENRSSCSIFVGEETPLASIGEEGAFIDEIGLNSVTQYFTGITAPLNVSYDYRHPSFITFFANDDRSAGTATIAIGDASVEVQFDQAMVAFEVPQSSGVTPLEDNVWWLPRSTSSTLLPQDSTAASNYKDVLGRSRFFEIPYFSGSRRTTVRPIDTKFLNGHVAFIYDISGVSDGLYISEVNSQNRYGVGEMSNQSEATIISRHPPALEFFTRTSRVRDRAELYFANDIAIAASGGWDDGTKIIDVQVNGQSVAFESLTEDEQVVHISQAAINELEIGQTYEITAIAENARGSIAERSINVLYAPVNFELSSVPSSVYRKVEPMRIGVKRTAGARCNFVSSREVALEIASPSRYSCYPEWHSVPDGMAAIFQAQNPYLYGSAHEDGDEISLGMDIVYVSHLGEELRFSTPTYTTTLLEPQPIDLGVVGRVTNEDGMILLPEGANDIARAVIGFTRGVVEYEVSYMDNEPYLSRSVSSSREYTEGTIRVTSKRPFEHEIFSENELRVRAWYRYAPDMEVEVNKSFLLVPNTSSRLTLASDVTEGNTLETISVTAALEKQFARKWVSDPALIGNYTVHIAAQVSASEYKPLTESKPLVNGIAEFELELSEGLSLGNNTLFAIATLNDPNVEGFESEIISKRLNFYLFSGEAIDGELQARTIEGPIPMRARMSYMAASLHESRLIEEYIWEYSEDNGATWVRDDSIANHSFSRLHEEPADYYVRVRVRNRLTGLESQSEEVRVIAYHAPRITIEGPSAVYRGLPQIFTATGVRGELSAEHGRFFWSFDRKEWTEGEPEIELELTEPTRLYAKFISHSADGRDLQRSAEAEAVRSIQVRSISPVSITASLPSLVEEGTVINMDARVRHAIASLDMPISIEWVDAGGNIYANGHEYEITEADINEDNSAEFTVRAWLTGFKEQTYSERAVRTRPWSYTTPEIGVELRSAHQIAPVNLRLGISHPLIFAPLVDIEYDWELPEGATITRTNSGGRYINVDFTEPGVYEVKAILRDSRGGESVAYEYIEVLEPADMEPTLELRFSEPHMRPPLRAVGRLYVERTHPDDRVDHIIWYQNGEQIGDPRSTGYFDLTEVGNFELKAEVHTRLGQVASVTEMVTLNPNIPPTCSPEVSETSTAFRVETNCTDSDGRIVRYEWEWLDGVSSQNRQTLSFSKSSYENLSVTFRVYDDSGDHSEYTVSW